MQKIIDYGHQGDINFRKVNAVPKGAKDITKTFLDPSRGGLTIALGEHTNHAHTILIDTPKKATTASEAVEMVYEEARSSIRNKAEVKIMEQDGRRYIVVNGAPVKLLHGTFIAPGKIKEQETDKHAGILLPPGIYEQGFEVGYDPFLRMKKQVID